jgi:exodeoxyribonuclease VII small subunit
MSDDRSTFENTRARLEDIVGQVRRKDVSLEQSLDLLEEAVRLVNQCNDLIDQTSFRAPAADASEERVPDLTVTDVVESLDTDGDGVADTVVETVTVSEDWGAEDAWAGDVGPSVADEDDERE